MTSFYDFSIKGIDGSDDLLGALRGNVALAVNVASKCGLTPQYTGLERLYREMKGQRFVVVGFPCNQFAGQEPGTESDIQTFCSTTYDVTFPLSIKIDVNGPTRHPLYNWLTAPDRGFPGDIQWNFEKFLIGRDGKLLHRYPPTTKPEDNGLMSDVGAAL
jgi:glutathione peroxidase